MHYVASIQYPKNCVAIYKHLCIKTWHDKRALNLGWDIWRPTAAAWNLDEHLLFMVVYCEVWIPSDCYWLAHTASLILKLASLSLERSRNEARFHYPSSYPRNQFLSSHSEAYAPELMENFTPNPYPIIVHTLSMKSRKHFKFAK